MRRSFWIGAAILLVVTAVVVGVGAYNAGVNHGLEQAASGTEVVRVVGPGYGYHGGWFLPFGFLFFPLFLIGIFLLVRGAFGPRRWGSDHGHGPWSGKGWGGPPAFEDWHRRQHEQATGDHPSSGGEPSTPA